jgi:hypothetical protein
MSPDAQRLGPGDWHGVSKRNHRDFTRLLQGGEGLKTTRDFCVTQ